MKDILTLFRHSRPVSQIGLFLPEIYPLTMGHRRRVTSGATQGDMVLVNGLEPLPIRLQGDCSTIGAKPAILERSAWTRTTIRRLTAFRNNLYTTDPKLFRAIIWSGQRESNPHHQSGRLIRYPDNPMQQMNIYQRAKPYS